MSGPGPLIEAVNTWQTLEIPSPDLWVIRTVGLKSKFVTARPTLAQAETYVKNYKKYSKWRKNKGEMVFSIEHYVPASSIQPPPPPSIPRILRDLAREIEAKAFEQERQSRDHDPPEDGANEPVGRPDRSLRDSDPEQERVGLVGQETQVRDVSPVPGKEPGDGGSERPG